MDAELIVRCINGILGGLGTVTNSLVFVLLLKHKLGSHLTNVLFRSQRIYDCFSCFIMFLVQLIGNNFYTSSSLLNGILCSIWSQENLFWPGPILAASNLVCLSLDRVLAVFKPVFYRQNQKRLIIASLTYNIVNILILFTPRILHRRFVNGTCLFSMEAGNDPFSIISSVHSYLTLVFAYLLPSTCLIVSHALIIYKIKNLFSRRTKSSPETSSSERDTVSALPRSDDQRALRLRRAIIELIITTVVVSSLYLSCYAFDLITYVLGTSGQLDYIGNQIRRQVGLGLIVLCACISPCAVVCTTRHLRLHVINIIGHQKREYSTTLQSDTQSESGAAAKQAD
ncbi:unnamed protein product [Echinostoma caproni]|uniref:G_PROTEIN_RECEP_F1_2 domain-containing protein n=1 Tax=Echinostoma caproni TaxID=27848 RepID=A0A183AFV7_9TREM|nr:unnamed protein product [Echinostoma caproni]